MSAAPGNVAASVRQRLSNVAKERGEDFEQILVRYALERLLYRLSKSRHVENFVLKGALLFRLWFDLEQRPTRDADFLGLGPADTKLLHTIFLELIELKIDHNDGLVFDVASLKAEEIRKDAGYPGVRVSLQAELARARIPVQCDIGFGDAVTPEPTRQHYPTLLDMPAPTLRAYPLETVVAEKLEALVKLGAFNSRLKDYFDLWVLMRYEQLGRELIPQAIRATFERRGTKLPDAIPAGLSEEFAGAKATMWLAFLKRSGLKAPVLSEVVSALGEFYWPLLQSAAGTKTVTTR
jgi:predicted nucleotidyltransferase component of viral defense system